MAAGKFHKARWVALAPSTTQALQGYLTHRSQSVPNAPDAPVLLNLRGRRLHECTVNHDFHRLLAHCGIAHQHSAPRVHDLRHTFAVHRLLAWYHEGRDVNALLPALATYMGHVDIRSTRVYLQPTAELLAAVDTRFHDHFLRMVKPQGGHP